MKAGKRILAAGGLVLAVAFGSAAVAEDRPPENTDPFDLFQGLPVAGTEDLAGTSGQVTQAISVPGVGFAITTTAQGTCTESESDGCRATTTSIVNVVGSDNGDVAASSFATTGEFSANNTQSSQFDTGSSQFDTGTIDAGGGANLPNLTAGGGANLPNLTAPIVTAPIVTAPNL